MLAFERILVGDKKVYVLFVFGLFVSISSGSMPSCAIVLIWNTVRSVVAAAGFVSSRIRGTQTGRISAVLSAVAHNTVASVGTNEARSTIKPTRDAGIKSVSMASEARPATILKTLRRQTCRQRRRSLFLGEDSRSNQRHHQRKLFPRKRPAKT